jgi:cell division transport system permease protein
MPKTLRRVIALSKKDGLFTTSNLIVMTITFFVFQTFLLFATFSQTALKKLEREALVTIFFKDDVPETRIMELAKELKANPKVYEVTYVSKDDAFKIFKELNKNEPLLLESVSASVLPASLEVKTKNVRNLEELARQYEQVDGVESVKYFKDIINNFSAWSRAIIVGIGFIFLMFAFLSFSILVSTIKSGITARKTEFEILKLVGASDEYIRRPLMTQGLYYGALACIISSSIWVGLFLVGGLARIFDGIGFEKVHTNIFGIKLSYSVFYLIGGLRVGYWFLLLVLIISTLILSLTFAALSARTAVKKFLTY